MHAHDQLDQLAAEVTAAGISRPQLEGIVYQLSGQQRRLFLHLARHGAADTVEIRRACSIGNISECASELNAKLARCGDTRRVICSVRPHRNQFGEATKLGVWRMVGGAVNDGQLPAA